MDPRQLPAAGADLAAKISQYADRWGPLAQANRIFAPVVDGEVLRTTPWQALAGGAAREVELIVGHNREEYRFFMVLGGQIGKISDEQATQALRALAPGPDGEHAYRQAYPCGTASRTGPVETAVRSEGTSRGLWHHHRFQALPLLTP